MEQLEGALLRLVALGEQLLDSLLASGVLLLRNDATLLGLHQILLGEATGSVLGSAVVNLGLGANSDHLATHHGVVAILTSRVGRVHSILTLEKYFTTWAIGEFFQRRFPPSILSFSWNHRLQQNGRGNPLVPISVVYRAPSDTH